MNDRPAVAYFSMEIGLDPSIPTYSGGLGILAGDTIRSAADLEIPMVAVSLLHRRGYFHQRIDEDGNQREEPVSWAIDQFLEPLDVTVTVELRGRTVRLRPWRYRVVGVSGFDVPVYLLDADLPENHSEDRRLTDELYGGDIEYRLCQEALLGLGGVRLLRALGHHELVRFHLNEGHAALVALALLEEKLEAAGYSGPGQRKPLPAVRQLCVFTTHTPVPAGHDRFHGTLVRSVLGNRHAERLRHFLETDELNMTELALRASRYVNGVAMSHWEVARGMFPGYPVRSITNGVHVPTWVAPSFAEIYDRYLPDWRRDAIALRYAIGIPKPAVRVAHEDAKQALVDFVNREIGAGFRRDVLTLGFARRATAYKRATLIFRDADRLGAIAERCGPIQLAFGGKAHPHDQEGKEIIRRIHAVGQALEGRVAIAYVPDYGMREARLLCAGSDVWLNTPRPPMEASGTSGMKAAVNGVPSLSVLDGWWVEGHVEGVTGWAIGNRPARQETRSDANDEADAADLYRKLEKQVIPCFYRDPDRFTGMMVNTIALNASFFNTQRMMWQYLHSAYQLSPHDVPRVERKEPPAVAAER